MEQTRKKMKFEILIDRYFSNFWSIMLTNLLFFVPLGLAILSYCLLSSFVGGVITKIAVPVLIVLLFPFYSGVVLVCRNMARGDKSVSVFKSFVKAVRDNYSRFLLFGALATLITVFTYYSVSIYSKLLSTSWMFYVALIVCILIALELLFIFFYLPIMTVTFDLSLKNIFKNSFLMSFGEIKNNFFALISLAVVIAIGFTLTALSTIEIILIIVTILLVALIIPASCQFVVSFFVYDDMYGSIADPTSKAQQISDAITDAKLKRENNGAAPQEDYSDVDISALNNPDDYIFYNGKMIKQSVLIERALSQRAQAESTESKDV